MDQEKEKVEAILQEIPQFQTVILKEILEAEKALIHRENLQGRPIIKQIVDLVKERVNNDK